MKIKKIALLILILTLIIAFLIPGICIAGDDTYGKIDTNDYKGGTTVTTSDAGRLAPMTSNILATIRNIGIISAVVILSIIGIKYMLGSLDEKANYKENMLIYVIGCILLTMATTIPSIVYDIMK